MIVMPANASGWFWHTLAHETGKIGHLFSPDAQRGPWPWMPYALDNGAFACWDSKNNTFDVARWKRVEDSWRHLLMWAQCAPARARWAIVPDVPGNGEETLRRWPIYAPDVIAAGIPLAIAVQDGMTTETVRSLSPAPEVIAVGGSTEWKWATAEQWAKDFPRVHVLRCNSPEKIWWLESLGVESCDGTGWNRGNRKQTEGLELWARHNPQPSKALLWPFVSKATDKNQIIFA
jgi:hypothetical protein